MKQSKEARGFSGFGFSTILLSFVMICVITFSALALVTANSDYRLSRAVADKTLEYYRAQEKAYQRLEALDRLCAECFASREADTYFAQIESLSRNYGTFQHTDGKYYLSFTEPMAENRYLTVTLHLSYPSSDSEPFYEIVAWESVYIRETPEEEYLNLMQ